MNRVTCSNLARYAFLFYLIPFLSITNKRLIGNPIFNYEWDVCIVLDACRADTFRTVATEFDIFNDTEKTDTMWSVGSNSPEWIQNTFRRNVLVDPGDVVYLSANGYAGLLHKPEQFYKHYGAVVSESQLNSNLIEKLISRKITGADELNYMSYIGPCSPPSKYTVTPPEEMTDAVLSYLTCGIPDQLIIHYMQPHAPYFGSGSNWTPDSIDRNPIDAARNGRVSEVQNRYRDTLRVTLAAVERLLKGLDNLTVLITADHGELFGEFGLYGHMPGFLHPRLREVPAVTIESGPVEKVEIENTDHWEPSESSSESDLNNIDSQLEALGYK